MPILDLKKNINAYIHMYICIYAYMYICIYTDMCVYIYIYILYIIYTYEKYIHTLTPYVHLYTDVETPAMVPPPAPPPKAWSLARPPVSAPASQRCTEISWAQAMGQREDAATGQALENTGLLPMKNHLGLSRNDTPENF